MKLVRMFTGADNRSHLEEMKLDLKRENEVVESMFLRSLGGRANLRVSTGTIPDLHPAPRDQYLTVLEGELDVVVGDGQQMAVGPGDVIQVEDTSGEGHILRFRNGCNATFSSSRRSRTSVPNHRSG